MAHSEYMLLFLLNIDWRSDFAFQAPDTKGIHRMNLCTRISNLETRQ